MTITLSATARTNRRVVLDQGWRRRLPSRREQRVELPDVVERPTGRRLVEQQDAGLRCEGSRDGEQALLGPGKLACAGSGSPAEPDLLQRPWKRPGATQPLPRGRAVWRPPSAARRRARGAARRRPSGSRGRSGRQTRRSSEECAPGLSVRARAALHPRGRRRRERHCRNPDDELPRAISGRSSSPSRSGR